MSDFRVGRVFVYRRGRVWYLRYHQGGKRHQIRVSADKSAARQLAAKVNAKLETGEITTPSFKPLTIAELRDQWLDHHEHVRRSSLQTVERYRTATQHLIRFIEKLPGRLRGAGNMTTDAVEEFVRWLRTIEVSPNGHANSRRRKLLDKGIVYVLDCCRSMFNFAIKRRQLPPYTDNPFSIIQTDAITIENAKPIILLSLAQEQQLLNACDDWDYPIFLTLMMTGLRPGELCHLLLPGDLNLDTGILRVSNKPRLGWQIKTRCDREVPLHPAVVTALRPVVNSRTTGAVFLRKQYANGMLAAHSWPSMEAMEREVATRIASLEQERGQSLNRQEILTVQKTLWRDLGAIDEDDTRRGFIRICRKINMEHQTAPKLLRHGFATMLQDANVDPLVRNLLMGHSTSSSGSCVVRQVGLGMTGVYTHTRAETMRRQLMDAINLHGVLAGIKRLALMDSYSVKPEKNGSGSPQEPQASLSPRPADSESAAY